MTRAPENLLAVRRLLLAYLNVDKSTVRAADLEPGEVGIVGDTAHRGGYHCGSDRVVDNDYSVVESARDSSGLTLFASALDVGMFTVTSGGRTHNLRTLSTWMVAQCKAGTADTRDIREVIYSPDGKVVRRWDRLGKRSTGDSSHLTHTHFSFFRDSTKAGRDLTPLFRRYLTSIGLLEDHMTPAQFVAILKDPDVAKLMRALPWQYVGGGIPAGMSTLGVLNELVTRARAGGDPVDEAAIVAGVLASLTAEAIAAAIPPELAAQVADELARRIAS